MRVAKISQLRSFIAVCRSGSIRSAAKQLNVAQPSVTKSLQLLEIELSTPLFLRNSQGAVPTAAGLAFLKRAETVVEELRRAGEEINQMRGGSNGQITFAVSSAVAFSLLVPTLRKFRRRYPVINLRILGGTFPVTFSELQSGRLDFAVGPKPALNFSSDLGTEKLFSNSCVVVCRADHPLRTASTLEQLVDQEWVLTLVTGSVESEIGPLFYEHGLSVPTRIVQCESPFAILPLLLGTDMVALLPRQWLDIAPLRGVIVPIPLRHKIDGPDICLVTRKGMTLTPAADHMIEQFKSAAKNAGLARA